MWPWIALIFSASQLLAAWTIINLLLAADRFTKYISPVDGVHVISGTDRTILYLGLVVLIINAIILIFAHAWLKRRQRKGWELLFLGLFLNVGYSMVSLFMRGRGATVFVFTLVGSIVGFYLLYQVRDKYEPNKSKI